VILEPACPSGKSKGEPADCMMSKLREYDANHNHYVVIARESIVGHMD
jgi:hypothetical protein